MTRVAGLLALTTLAGMAAAAPVNASVLFDASQTDPMATITFQDTANTPAAVCSAPRWVNGQRTQRIGVMAPSRVAYYYRNASTFYHTEWRARVWDVEANGYVWSGGWIRETDYRSNPVAFPQLSETSYDLSYAHHYVATVELRWLAVTGNVTAYRKFQHEYYKAFNANGTSSVLYGKC